MTVKIYEAPRLYPNLNDETKFRLNKTNEIKEYFIAEIREWETTSKRLSKYIAAFDYSDNALIALSVTRGGISIIYFSSSIGVPVEIASESCFSFENYWKQQEIKGRNITRLLC